MALTFAVVTSAQTLKGRPSFSDYPVAKIYRGTPVPPKLSRDQRTFRTMIRFGAKEKVEFAGHYTLPDGAAVLAAAC